MKTVLRFTFILFTLSFVLSSCGKEAYHKLSDSQKLEGIWTFDKVKFRKSGTLSKEEVTNAYHLSSIQFNLDGSFVYSDHPNEMMYNGNWEMFTYYEYDTEDNDEEEVNDLYLDLFDSNDVFIETWHWPDFTFRKNKICAEELKPDGKYWIDLERVIKK